MALLVTGCGQLGTRPTASAKTPEATSGINAPASNANSGNREVNMDDELLNYGKHFGELSVENQRKELTLVMQALSRNKRDTNNRLKAALIYSLPGSRLRDSARALPLLIDLQRDKPTEEDINALVSLLRDFVEERQRLEESNSRLTVKVRDEQQRIDDLQLKLDALKNIDKTMIERSQGINKK
jgi:hypothetical protein